MATPLIALPEIKEKGLSITKLVNKWNLEKHVF